MSLELGTADRSGEASVVPAHVRSTVKSRWRGRIWRAGVAATIVLAIALVAYRQSVKAITTEDPSRYLLHTVQRGDFEAFVSESGDIQSANNVEVRCEVKSEGAGGTTILEITEEGSVVQEGDFLVQFDDSALKLLLTQQEIVVAQDETAVIGAESDLDKARQTLDEYKDGLFLADSETFESELLQAQSNLKAAQDLLEHTSTMFRKGYVSQLQLEAQQVAVEMAQKNVKVAETKLKVHTDFTYKRMISEYEAEIKKLEAALRAAQFTLKLSQQRRDEVQTQIDKCRVLAPAAGQVVYANDFERQQNIVIEEGAQVREGQIVIRLPNPERMQVRARINDSKIKQVKLDDSVTIELDVNPTLPVYGVVTKINSFPYPREWYGGPIEYGVELNILNPPAGLTPGQRAKAKILVEKLQDVVQVPIQSVVEKAGSHFCMVRNSTGDWEVRKVAIGSDNGSFVVLQEGVDEGEQVALNPELLWEHLAPDAAATQPPSGLVQDTGNKWNPDS
jgi:HlyD family secretion protein